MRLLWVLRTEHRLKAADSRRADLLPPDSVDLVLTSPPYPMIEMWDGLFERLNADVKQALDSDSGAAAFDLMHGELDKVWENAFRCLRPGRFLIVNIGDATRNIHGNFSLYSNHARIIQSASRIGFQTLPNILWRKQTNSPNKFMGSGMLPAGAYVTLEHEHILVFRKHGKRVFKTPEEKNVRMRSALFWEERNNWYSDVWTDLKGERQRMGESGIRERSAAFPFAFAYRLIHMFSVQGDMIHDPFLGTGTTMLAALAAGRNSCGFEIEDAFTAIVERSLMNSEGSVGAVNSERLKAHTEWVKERSVAGYEFKHKNRVYGFPVMTGQETELVLPDLTTVVREGPGFISAHYRLLERTEMPGSARLPEKLADFA